MVREAKNVDFYTSGKMPSDEDFAKISEWIKAQKGNTKRRKKAVVLKKQIVTT